MRRILLAVVVFGLLGPPTGWAALLLAAPSLLGQGPFDTSVFGGPVGLTFLAGLPVAYWLGFVPALLVAALHIVMERYGLRRLTRIAACSAGGGLLSLSIIHPLYASGSLHGPLPLAISISGICAGAVCSLIAPK